MRISESACPRPRRRLRISRFALGGLLVLAWLPACQMTPPQASGSPSYSSPSPSEYRPVSEYLSYMHVLAIAQPATHEDLYQQAARFFREQQTPHARLRFALALAMLDPPYGDVAKASKLYKELLPPNGTPPADIESLMLVRVNEIKHRITLEERLALLQQSLDKAEAKIQALTTIEKTLEQPVTETKPKAAP